MSDDRQVSATGMSDSDTRDEIISLCREIKARSQMLSDKRESAIYIRYAEDIAARTFLSTAGGL